MKEMTVELKDSDGNFIMSLIQYNPSYPQDFRVLSANVTLKVSGTTHAIDNMEMVRAQYYQDIFKIVIEEISK
jgi:hypothetical protein